ncbi:MAG: hypothetical protein H6970_11265 [Gammaproteobacteria bacterium]|nr:hypothetical protein [Gammaproteobacteria bacterium]MCP5425628.1 hypothetical protein [Gammaproteobacteria bacterium]MCP5458974.1 hypothetical protein [Gammaproteobacteria bacterium]
MFRNVAHWLIPFLLSLLAALPSFAAEPRNFCDDSELNQQWNDALSKYPKDPLLLKLSAVRTALCGMVHSGQINLETARTTWEDALTDALLEWAKDEQAKRGLLRLFGTF